MVRLGAWGGVRGGTIQRRSQCCLRHAVLLSRPQSSQHSTELVFVEQRLPTAGGRRRGETKTEAYAAG